MRAAAVLAKDSNYVVSVRDFPIAARLAHNGYFFNLRKEASVLGRYL